MGDKLQRKQVHSDASHVLPRAFTGDSNIHTAAEALPPPPPPLRKDRSVKSDSKTYPALNDSEEVSADLLKTATSLLSPAKQHELDGTNAKSKRIEKSAVPSHIRRGVISSSFSSLQAGGQNPQGNAYLDGSGRHGGHALGHQSNRYSFDRDIANDDRTLVTTSLLNPHPAIIPPPGSRLAFAGADSRVTINKFRSLPSLEDTLLRRAKAPLCLYNYWQYLADIESCPEELEFWLSLADYEELHRRFTDSKPPVPSSGITPQNKRQRSQFLSIATGGSRFTSMRIDNGTADKHHIQEGAPATTGTELVTKGQQNAAYDNLDMDTQLLDSYLADLSYQTATAVEGSKCSIHRQCRSLHCPFTSGLLGGAPILDTPVRVTHTRGVRGFFSRIFSGESNANSVDVSQAGSVGHRGDNLAAPLLSSITSSSQEILKPGLHKQPHAVITEDEIRHSAEQLYFQYVLPGAPSELFLGPQMREDIASRIENERRYDAELFAPAKRHAYEAMRHESYPRFLRERLFHNITRGTAAPRIALGLALIFVALTSQFSLIFLDVKPKAWRWLPLAALWPGFAYAFAGVSRLDPFLAILGRYEPSAWRFEHVCDAAIRDSHLKRATLQLSVTALISAIITLILFLVPGHHL